MGIIKDNEDNLEEESLTFFLDDSKKLNEFVLNKQMSGSVFSSGDLKDKVAINIISDNQTLKELDQKGILIPKSNLDEEQVSKPKIQGNEHQIASLDFSSKAASDSISSSTSNSSSP